MKKTFKLVIIFIGGLTAIIVGALTGYLLISKNKTFYIYDVRLVEPIEGRAGYIYYDKGNKIEQSEEDATGGTSGESEKVENVETIEYKPIKNKIVYMKSQATNICPIAVYVSSSDSVNNVSITSSDKDIARIVYKDGGCFVEYLKEGFVTITSEFYGVKDSFSVQIYDQLPSEFNVYDYDYYGDYAELFPNTLVSYADNVEYRYDYFLNNVSNTGTNENIDGDLIRIDQENLQTDVFENVYIDSATNELVVKCKKPEEVHKDNIDSTIILQSFYYAEDGRIVIENNYEVKVHVVRYIPEFLQLEVSATPDFEEKIVFTNTERKDISSLSSEEILANPSLLDEYLMAEKAENYLTENGEKATYKAYFANKIERLYVRVRMVYTNGDIVYLKNGENATITFNGLTYSDYCEKDPTDDYYVMTLNDTNYFTTDGKLFELGVLVDDFSFSHTFNFEYKERTEENCSLYYDYDTETGIYTYKYWDDRVKFDNEIYDKDGNVVAFGV